MGGMLITEILVAVMRGGAYDKSLTCLSATNSINKIDKIKEINPKNTRTSEASLTGTAAAAKAWRLILLSGACWGVGKRGGGVLFRPPPWISFVVQNIQKLAHIHLM